MDDSSLDGNQMQHIGHINFIKKKKKMNKSKKAQVDLLCDLCDLRWLNKDIKGTGILDQLII